MTDTTPVFIHAWWRSSSTYVWSKLRANPALCCYYEPLNERIATLEKNSVDASPDAPPSIALRHPVPERNYFAEYFEFPTSAVSSYSPEFAYDRYLLRADDVHPALQTYLSGLVTSASDAGRRPVLCFCRSQMRSGWMKRQFGGIHVAQIRNPISQVSSFRVSRYFTVMMLRIGVKLCAAFPQAFAHISSFARQAGTLSAHGGAAEPVKFSVTPGDAFRLFLLLWVASSLQAVAQADRVLDVDLLAIDPAYRETVCQWFASDGCAVDFSDCSTPGAHGGPWTKEVHDLIDEAVQAIRTHAACLVSEDPGAIRLRMSQLSPSSGAILERALASG
jgi:hypothetical protein